jgi:flavin reductase (DIM6/NTAB) family NADH-FMN oxidoreductase RutF
MYFDPDQLDGKNVYKLITSTVLPRPIAWVVSQNGQGRLNAAPFSFFNAMSVNPPVVALGIGAHGQVLKDSARNIRESGEFVINLVPFALVEAMNITSIEFEAEVNELEMAGLATLPSTKVAPPRISGSPVAFECRTLQIIELGEMRSIVLANVVAIHIDDEAVLDAERCHVDVRKLDLVGRMHGGGWYARLNELFEQPRIDLADWQARGR